MTGFCAGSSIPNCSASYTTIQPDPDIGGIGVLISFLLSAAITLFVSILGIAIFHLPKRLDEASSITLSTPAAVVSTTPQATKSIRKLFRQRVQVSDDIREYWLTVIERFLLGMADQQLVTGTACLVVGFIKCDITVYHFTIVTDLAWFSSSTHLSAMRILNRYLREYTAARFWRVIVMLVMYSLLMTSSVLESNDSWYASLPSPARCLFKATSGNVTLPSNAFWLAFNIGITTWAYATTIIPLFPSVCLPIRNGWNVFLKQAKSLMKSTNSRTKRHVKHRSKVVRVIRALTNGDLLDIYFEVFWFAFSLWSIITDRAYGEPYMSSSDVGAQSSWGFGQLVPVFLISLPILTALEIFYEETQDFTARKQSRIALSILGTGQEAMDDKGNDGQAVELCPQRPDSANPQDVEIIQQPSEAVSTQGDTNHGIPEASEHHFQHPVPTRVDTEMRIGMVSMRPVRFPRDEASSASTYPLSHNGRNSSNAQYRADPLETQTTLTISHGD